MVDQALQISGKPPSAPPSGPFRVISGLVNGVVDHLWVGGILTLALSAAKFFAPSAWGKVLQTVGGEELLEKTTKDIKEGGLPRMVWDSAKLGFGIAGAWGGVRGMFGAGQGGDVGGGVTGVIGTGLAMAAVAAVTVGVVMNTDVKPAGNATTGTKEPPPTPPAGKAPPSPPKR